MSLAKVISRATVSTVAGFVLAGCAVGPDFERPAAPATSGYTARSLPEATAAADGPGGIEQRFRVGEDITAAWWTLFQSPALNSLIAQAIKNSPSLKMAEAALRQAQETLYAQQGIIFPDITGDLSQLRQKSYGAFGRGGAVSVPAYTISTASVSVSYALDIFGGARRALESTKAQAEQSRYQMEAAYLTLTSNVVIAAIQQASLRAQVEATTAILDAQEQQLGVLQRQLELGGVAEADVLTQRAAVAQTRAQLPALQKLLAQSRTQLLALAGRFPDEEFGAAFDLGVMHLPADLPVSLPSQLVQQRPDIRASEAGVHAASAQIGLATAQMLPQISLNGRYGSSASSFADLLSAGAGIWSLSAGLTQPIFKGGELLHRRRGAVAAYDAAAAQYRGTVLSAFQNVSDVLNALQVDADALKAQSDAERAAAENFAIAQNRYQSGATNFLTLLDAQRSYQQARIALVQAQASRFADTAALFVALGGGWWNRTADSATTAGLDDERPVQ